MDAMNNYVKVATNCNQYSPRTTNLGVSNVAGESSTPSTSSCLNCNHFLNQHCELDLYDKIKSTLNAYGSR